VRTLRNGITVVIPSIPPRAELLQRAVASALDQTMPAAAISVAIDCDRLGAALTRQRALDAVQTRWVAFLDDDDEFRPNHLAALFSATVDFGALYVWSRFQTAIPRRGMRIPTGNAEFDYVMRDGPAPLGAGTFEQWNDRQPAQTTITTLVSTELARSVGGFAPAVPCSKAGCPDPAREPYHLCVPDSVGGQRAGEDWDFTLRCRQAVLLSEMRHVPEVTWTWHHHGANTSGLPERW
jgi:hypothetical protein